MNSASVEVSLNGVEERSNLSSASSGIGLPFRHLSLGWNRGMLLPSFGEGRRSRPCWSIVGVFL
jgi:hypothetical protein